MNENKKALETRQHALNTQDDISGELFYAPSNFRDFLPKSLVCGLSGIWNLSC